MLMIILLAGILGALLSGAGTALSLRCWRALRDGAWERRAAPPREREPEQEAEPARFRLDDAKMQEGIANLLSYDIAAGREEDGQQ